MLNRLNPKANNEDAFFEASRQREKQRISRAGRQAPIPPRPSIVLNVGQALHGFTAGQPVNRIAGTWSLASNYNLVDDDQSEFIGVVIKVVNADSFRVAVSGLESIYDPTFAAVFSGGPGVYYLGNTAGSLALGFATTNAQARAVVISHGQNLYEFLGATLASSHNHVVSELVNQSAHGFAQWDWVSDQATNASAGYAKAWVGNANGARIGVVTNVVDANYFHVCFYGMLSLGSGGISNPWSYKIGAVAALIANAGKLDSFGAFTSGFEDRTQRNMRCVCAFTDNNQIFVSGLDAAAPISLAALADVSYTGSPAAHDVLQWDGAEWTNGPVGSWLRPQDLSTVGIVGSLTQNQFLITYLVGGTAIDWKNLDYSINTIGDVNTSGATTGQALVFNGTGWIPGTISPTTSLAALTDVNLTSPANNDALIFDSGTSKWINKPAVLTLEDLTDVTITSAANGDILQWTGTAWVNIATAGANQFLGCPIAGSGAAAYRILDPRDMPRRGVTSSDLTGSGVAAQTFAYDAVWRFMTASAAYSDLDAASPTGPYFKAVWSSGAIFGSDSGTGAGALVISHTTQSNNTFAINRKGELQIQFGIGPTNTITLQLAAIVDLVGASVSPAIAGGILIAAREINICVGGVAKKVIVLASQDY